MNRLEKIIYIQGIGDEPREQEHLSELYEPYGINVEHQPIDWANTDYNERLIEIDDHIKQLSKQCRVSLVGASGGGKAVLDLFIRHPNHVHRTVTISAKIDPYDLKLSTREEFPNLAISSDVLPSRLSKIHPETLKRILCVHPTKDRVVEPKDATLAGAHELTVPAEGHIEGITYALTIGSALIADFIKQD